MTEPRQESATGPQPGRAHEMATVTSIQNQPRTAPDRPTVAIVATGAGDGAEVMTMAQWYRHEKDATGQSVRVNLTDEQAVRRIVAWHGENNSADLLAEIQPGENGAYWGGLNLGVDVKGGCVMPARVAAPDVIGAVDGCIADPPARCARNCYSDPTDPDTLCQYAQACDRFRRLVLVDARALAAHAAIAKTLEAIGQQTNYTSDSDLSNLRGRLSAIAALVRAARGGK